MKLPGAIADSTILDAIDGGETAAALAERINVPVRDLVPCLNSLLADGLLRRETENEDRPVARWHKTVGVARLGWDDLTRRVSHAGPAFRAVADTMAAAQGEGRAAAAVAAADRMAGISGTTHLVAALRETAESIRLGL